MTPAQFCIWLEGYLDGNELMDPELREKLREKLGVVGEAPAAKTAQPKSDVPKTADSSPFRSGITGALTDLVSRGSGGITPAHIGMPLGGPLSLYDSAMTTVCTNTTGMASAVTDSNAH